MPGTGAFLDIDDGSFASRRPGIHVGAIIARFQPHGMARALFATALAQMLVGVIALIAGLGLTLILNGLFAALWVGSALLFRRAARTQPV